MATSATTRIENATMISSTVSPRDSRSPGTYARINRLTSRRMFFLGPPVHVSDHCRAHLSERRGALQRIRIEPHADGQKLHRIFVVRARTCRHGRGAQPTWICRGRAEINI